MWCQNHLACWSTRGWDVQEVIPMSRSTQPTEKASTVEHAGELIERQFLRILGTDESGREHCWKPATGEIVVREAAGLDREVHEKIDAGSKTRMDYREFVETETDVEVSWNEGAFGR